MEVLVSSTPSASSRFRRMYPFPPYLTFPISTVPHAPISPLTSSVFRQPGFPAKILRRRRRPAPGLLGRLTRFRPVASACGTKILFACAGLGTGLDCESDVYGVCTGISERDGDSTSAEALPTSSSAVKKKGARHYEAITSDVQDPLGSQTSG